MKIRDHLEVLPQPTVVRLDQLRQGEPRWISESYYITEDAGRYLKALAALLARPAGCGVFVIGHYGSGKSHFLAYVAQQLESGSLATHRPAVVPISLLNFAASRPLETIVHEALGLVQADADRRRSWQRIAGAHPAGIVLLIDELSEFLRSKPEIRSFNEDLRYLQFLGEWAQEHRLWVVAALQEQIEHTGDIEYDLYRKIKDRYPVRFLLTPAHVRDLVSHRILRKKESFGAAVERLVRDLKGIYPEIVPLQAEMCALYPLHPATMELLEEVRDRFSQARGIVDFTVAQMLGDDARGFPPFLDMPWGAFITPDRIVDHFADLFEVQPEFLAIAQKFLPYYRKRVAELFDKPPQQELAWRLLKLLILVHLSPRRKWLTAEQACQWLLLKVSRLDPEKNREIVAHILDELVQKGAYLKRQAARYRLDLEDAGRQDLDWLLARAVEEVRGRGDSLFESLVPCLDDAEFNPFSLPRDRWHARRIRWHFHERELSLYLGGGAPPEPQMPALQIGLPWGPPAAAAGCFKLLPRPMEVSLEILELAALAQLAERPLPAATLERVRDLRRGRASWFAAAVRASYREGKIIGPYGEQLALPPLSPDRTQSWLDGLGEWILRRTYPSFERFAPGHGPLPKEHYRVFMKFASENDLGAENAPDPVRLIREAYLLPMGLMRREGAEYRMIPRLDHHELVRLLAPMIEHQPQPERLYRHLAAPPYGLVQDQVHLLLLVLLIQGEIDILKGKESCREFYHTLPTPLQYDRIVPGRTLTIQQMRDLEILCGAFRIPQPKQWSILAQKRCVGQLRRIGEGRRSRLSDLLLKLKEEEEADDLRSTVENLMIQWQALDKGENELQGLQLFLYAIGSAERFVAEEAAAASLLERFDELARETRRFRHLFAYPCIAQCADAAIIARVEALGAPPSLAHPREVEAWLERAREVYGRYREWYARRHEEWCRAAEAHAAWHYRPPALARSRHLGLGTLVAEVEALQAKARSQRCPGLSAMDFQPMCRCGFDGRSGPLDETLGAFEEAARRLENEMALFFRRDDVRARVRAWVEQQLEVNEETLAYLDGGRAYPAVDNVPLFDQHLAGLELVQTVPDEALLEVVGERTWESEALLRELRQFFGRFGARVRLTRAERRPRRELLAWCCELGFRHGYPLPEGLQPQEQDLLAELLRPEWVGSAALEKLERMNAGEKTLERVLQYLLDGAVAPPAAAPESGPVAAAMELLRPQDPATAAELCARAAMLYGEHERFMRIRPRAWLARLDRLATAGLPQPPPALEELLRRNLQAQWLVVDCLGALLEEAVRAALGTSLPEWRIEEAGPAAVSADTSTSGLYRSLVESGIHKKFDKIDAVDALIHERRLAFRELLTLARAELEIGLKQLRARLDPACPLFVYGDHGFRLAPDGRGYTHGGPSALERIVFTCLLRTAHAR